MPSDKNIYSSITLHSSEPCGLRLNDRHNDFGLLGSILRIF